MTNEQIQHTLGVLDSLIVNVRRRGHEAVSPEVGDYLARVAERMVEDRQALAHGEKLRLVPLR
jgi:hypothetical protein